jgi:phosphoribosylglycinamide formyltransferase-1
LLSGGGRTLQNLLDRGQAGRHPLEVTAVVSDRAGAFGIQRAHDAKIPTLVTRTMDDTFDFVRAHGAELVCLCGYLRLLEIPADFRGRVLNIHPSLLPRFGGKGFYGDRVHAAVLAGGDRESGCTVHAVDDEYDRGPILLQARVPVEATDDVATLAARVFRAECEAYPAAIALWASLRGE